MCDQTFDLTCYSNLHLNTTKMQRKAHVSGKIQRFVSQVLLKLSFGAGAYYSSITAAEEIIGGKKELPSGLFVKVI